tara:strand:+ start:1756 stop:2433 length:678 start_codon:yes stop_codon:yes gene_type:complete
MTKDIEKLLSPKVLSSQLYLNSLTHRSASNKNNELLEFFGDAILGFIIAEFLFNKYPADDEGSLSRKRSYLVRKETLSKIAKDFNIGKKIILGEGEKKSGGNKRDSIISDALEALIAVVYIVDGYDETKKFINNIFKNYLEKLPLDDDLKDSKTKLQELLQSQNCDLPKYDTEELVLKNEINFKTICKISKYNIYEEGVGSSKRKSQQEAASRALDKINSMDIKS